MTPYHNQNINGYSALNTQLITDPSSLRDIVPSWDLLARQALEPNPFYESWMLLPALEQLLEQHHDVSVLLIWKDASHSLLIGFFPLTAEQTYQKMPANHWTNWLHAHCPLGTPLVHQDHAIQAVVSFFQWLQKQVHITAFSLNKIPLEGLFIRIFKDVAQEQKQLLDDSDYWERALLNSTLSPDDYLQMYQGNRKLKKYRRLRQRLSEVGDLEFHTLMPGQTRHLDQWIREFLQLEQSGWKGEKHTALACRPNERVFAEELIRHAAMRGQLMMMKMTLDDTVIAIHMSILGATFGAFAFKGAYDERYAKYSPGVLLDLENIYVTLDNKQTITWMDSCATPDHPVLNRLWAERKRMVNLHVSTRHILSKPLVYVMRTLRVWKIRYASRKSLHAVAA